MVKIHKSCYLHYVNGDEYEACPSCWERLLDAEELVCLNAYRRDWKPVSIPPYPCWCGSCNFGCHYIEFWTELFARLHRADDGVCRLLPADTSPEEYDCLYHAGYVIAYRITKDDDDAHDAVQNAFFKIHRLPECPRSLRAVFFVSVKNAAFDIVRNRKQYLPIDELQVSNQATYCDAMVAKEEVMSLALAMEKLPLSDQQILHMHYIEGISHEQIALRLEVPKTTVNMRLSKARRRLKEKLQQTDAFAAT